MAILSKLLACLFNCVFNCWSSFHFICFQHIAKSQFLVLCSYIFLRLPVPINMPVLTSHGLAHGLLQQKLQIVYILGDESHTRINLLDHLDLIPSQRNPPLPTKPLTAGRLKREHPTETRRDPHTASRIRSKSKRRAPCPDQSTLPPPTTHHLQSPFCRGSMTCRRRGCWLRFPIILVGRWSGQMGSSRVVIGAARFRWIRWRGLCCGCIRRSGSCSSLSVDPLLKRGLCLGGIKCTRSTHRQEHPVSHV